MSVQKVGWVALLAYACSISTADPNRKDLPALKLIPSPQSLTMGTGEFQFGEATLIALGKPDDTKDRFAALQLQHEIDKSLNRTSTLGTAKIDRKMILLGVAGRDEAVDSALGSLQLEVPKGPNGDEAYILNIQPGRILIAGRTAKGVFYGVQSLKQIIRGNAKGRSIPACTIRDWPALVYRGWQDDVSRGPIPTMAFLKKQVRQCSEFKLNTFTLYTEHVFKLRKHPTIAPSDGLSAEQVRELSAYAKQFHVELIGNFQSFGHFANILNVPGYEKMGESGWVLSPAKEESYTFLKDVFSEIAPSYESPLFNINCDETGGLGEGASRRMVQQMGIGGVYALHINRVAELLRPYGKTPMMWGDIALQHRDIVPKLPKDLIVLSWGYHPAESFLDAIQPFTTLGFRFMVCPGVSCWSQIYPNLDAAQINISNYVRDGARLGAMGMLNTTWDDSGENLFENNWLMLAWGAECAWKPANGPGIDRQAAREARYENFGAAFDSVFFSVPGDSLSYAMRRLSALRGKTGSGALIDQSFWVPLATLSVRPMPIAEVATTAREANGLMEVFKAFPKRNVECVENAALAARKVRFIADRAFIVALMANTQRDPWSRQEAIKLLGRLATEAVKIRDDYARLWRLENHDWWLDRNLSKYNRLIAELKAAPDAPMFLPSSRAISGSQYISISNLSGAPIRYTTDGSEPNVRSPLFVSPLNLTKTTRLRARSFAHGGTGKVFEATYFALAFPSKVSTNLPVHDEDIPERAFDADEASFFWSSREAKPGDWIIVSLEKPIIAHSIRILSGNPDHSQDFVHQGVLEISPDGVLWEKVMDLKGPDAKADIFGKKVKAVRVRITGDSRHWLLVREVELRASEG